MAFDADEFTHPAWEEGRRAFHAGVPVDGNPHDFGTDANDAWSQGWQEALADSEGMTRGNKKRRR